jgi:hypothetical protein
LAFEALSGQGCNWFYGFAVKENSEDLRVSITLGGEARDFMSGLGWRTGSLGSREGRPGRESKRIALLLSFLYPAYGFESIVGAPLMN